MKTKTMSRLLAVLMAVMMVFSVVPMATLSLAAPAAASTSTTVKLSKCTFTYEKNTVYTGKARKPALKVTYGNQTLVSGKDYTVTYQNNKAVGIATMTVTAKRGSGFTGSKTLKFVIRPAKVKALTTTKQSTTGIRLSWSAVKGATGYCVYTYDTKTKTYTRVKATTKTAATIKNLKEGTTYRFAVRAFAKANGKIIYGVYSAKLKAATKAGATPTPQPLPDGIAKVTGVEFVKNGTAVTLTWNKAANALGYQICSYDPETGKYATMAKATTNKVTLSNLELQKPYLIAVRGYTSNGDSTVYGDFSDPVKVTVFFADKYSALFQSGCFQATIKTDMEGMTDPVTIATKDGNLYMKTKMAISDSSKTTITILYLKKTGKTYMKMGSVWFDATSVMGGDDSMLDVASMFTGLEFGNTDAITVSSEKIGSTTYVVETIPGENNSATKLYFKDGTLARIVTVERGRAVSTTVISSITDQVDDKLFKKPKMAVDLSALDM